MSGPTTLVVQTTISGMEQNLQLKSAKESYYHISGKFILYWGIEYNNIIVYIILCVHKLYIY